MTLDPARLARVIKSKSDFLNLQADASALQSALNRMVEGPTKMVPMREDELLQMIGTQARLALWESGNTSQILSDVRNQNYAAMQGWLFMMSDIGKISPESAADVKQYLERTRTLTYSAVELEFGAGAIASLDDVINALPYI